MEDGTIQIKDSTRVALTKADSIRVASTKADSTREDTVVDSIITDGDISNPYSLFQNYVVVILTYCLNGGTRGY